MTLHRARSGSAGRHSVGLIATMTLLIAAGSTAVAAGDDGDAVRERWLALFKLRAESLDVSFPGDSDRTVAITPEPAMVYTNPVRKELPYGSLFVWTEAGCPVFAAAYWSALEQGSPGIRRLSREFHALTDATMAVDEAGKRAWTSSEPGIEWRPIRAAAPRGSRPLRLTQMRRIAGRVQAEIETRESELRLMPQPIYRYPEGTAALDGALFAFVMGTDPELLVHIEARSSDDGTADWFLGFSHFTNAGVRATLDEAEVYRADHWTELNSTGRHHIAFGVERLPEDLSDSQETGK